MRIYIDSAQVKRWTTPEGVPPLTGVTTNPTLVHQAGLPVNLATYDMLVRAVADHGLAELMLQLPDSDVAQAIAWQQQLEKVAQQKGVVLTLKLPCHPAWQACMRAMVERGQPFLLTGLSNPIQLLWAVAQKAAYVAPYVGRLVSDGRDVWPLLEACVAMQAQGTHLLAASVKSHEVLSRLVAMGAQAVTLPPESLLAWAHDPVTGTAVSQFAKDIAASLQHGTAS